jgi:hypothetical protein
LLLDEVLYPRYRARRVTQPVFIVGVPRSGTTFLHRELAQDSNFTSSSTWEALFAPAICQRRFINLLAVADARIGSPIKNCFDRWFNEASSEIQDVHPTRLDAAEEDYLLMLSTAGCFFASIAFPAAKRLADLGRLSAMAPKRRERLLKHYHRVLQRQLYCAVDSQLLSKNAAFASWAPYLANRYPDALIIVCIREPKSALASQLRSLQGACRVLSTFPDKADLERHFAEHYSHWHQCLRELCQQSQQVVVVEQEWLRKHSRRIIDFVRDRRQSNSQRFVDAARPTATCDHAITISDQREAALCDHYQVLQQIARNRWACA